MKTYGISMPITGLIYKEIEAESEEQAKEAFNALEFVRDDIDDWDCCEAIVTGNVFHGHINEMEIEELDDV